MPERLSFRSSFPILPDSFEGVKDGDEGEEELNGREGTSGSTRRAGFWFGSERTEASLSPGEEA
jgi:hypothetical protein